jgi:predicted RNA binding protein YcfA (HicA-like mRNA interferase family)
MKAVSGRVLARALEHQGWELLRVHGSHHIYGKPGDGVRLTIPMHENQVLYAGLQHHLMTMAGMTEADL